MRRLLLTCAAATALGIAGLAAGAAEHQVKLTGSGIQPANTQVGWGDTIVFTNADSVSHTLQIPRLQLSQEIPAGGTHTQKFDVQGGSYQLRDRVTPRTYAGRVDVAVAGVVTLAAPATVGYGKALNVKGTSPYGDTPVVVETRPTTQGSAWTQLTTVTPTLDGAYVAAVTIQRGGRVVATAAGGQLRSAPVVVSVIPVLTVSVAPKRPAAGAFAKITAKLLPAGAATTASLERYDALRKRWVRAKTASFRSKPTAAFAIRATKVQTSYRIVIGRSSTQPGFVAVLSKPFKIPA
jgi:Cupredoxin-like domain